MNNTRIFPPHIIFLFLILIIFSVGVHFLHDLQPGHSDIFGSITGVCNGAIHYGIFMSMISGMILVALIVKIYTFLWQFPRLHKISVLVPPPIQ